MRSCLVCLGVWLAACQAGEAAPREVDRDRDAHDAEPSAGDAASAQVDAGVDAGSERDAGADAAAPDPLEPVARRAGAIPVGIENVNDSPLKSASYRTLLRFVADADVTIDRFYFGYKLRGAACWDAGNAGYGAGDGGTLSASLVDIDVATGLPGAVLASETVNGCTRHEEALAELGSTPVLVWVNTPATLRAGRMYGLVVQNTHAEPAENFFSFNMPLAATELAGPHARNELSASAAGAIMALDPREHVAWSEDGGATWRYGSENGEYRSYLNDRDTDHPATRIPQYGYRVAGGETRGPQPYYAYGTTCTGCSVSRLAARHARSFSELGGFTADDEGVGTLTLENTSTGERASCTPPPGFGFRTCRLATPVHVAVGEDYTVSTTGTVEVMELDLSQRTLFPRVGTADDALSARQAVVAAGTQEKDVPSLWAGPLSAHFPGE